MDFEHLKLIVLDINLAKTYKNNEFMGTVVPIETLLKMEISKELKETGVLNI